MLNIVLAISAFSVYAETEPNNDASTANVLDLNGSNTGELISPDDYDWWKITTTEDGALTITTTSTTSFCLIMYLYDGNATTELTNNYSLSCDLTVKSITYDNLAPGTYFIKCRRYSGEGSYTISNQFTAATLSNDSEPNDSAQIAQVLPLNGSATGHIGYYGNGVTDNFDWWKITTTEDGKLTINTITNSTVCLISNLYDQDTITELTNTYPPSCSDTNRTMVYNNLAPGTYFIKCYRYSGVYSSYSITSQFTPADLPNDPEPNDSAQIAQVLPLNGSATGHLGYHGNGVTDIFDWWKVTTTEDGKLSINILYNSTICVEIYLYDQNSSSLLTSDVYCSDTNKTIFYNNLIPGTYFIKCYKYNGYGTYTITSQFTPADLPNDLEPNDSAQIAQVLPLNDSLTGHLGYHGNGVTDIFDWWKVTTTEDGKLSINILYNSTICVEIYLYDQNSSSLLTSDVYCSDTNKTIFYNNLIPGTYFIKCYKYNGYGTYTITSQFTPADLPNDLEPNDSAQIAQVLPLNDSLTGHLGYHGNGVSDLVDWWKINIPQAGKLTINTITNSTICLISNLYDQDTITELTNTYPPSCSDTSRTMTSGYLYPGTYFIKCYRYSGVYSPYWIKSSLEPAPIAKFGFVGHINNFSFNDSSLYATSYLWNFGDGTTSTVKNPSHTYQQPGVYNVCLIASNNVGPDTFCDYITIKGIKSINVNHGGNSGQVTVYVYGGGFTPGTTFKLSRNGYPDIIGDTTIIPFTGAIRSTFDLTGKQPGEWDVVVEIPGDTIMTVPNGFTIEGGIPADPWVDVIGRDKVLYNRWYSYDITYGNNGNVDALGVPLWIVVSNAEGIEVNFSGFELVLPKAAIDSGWTQMKDSVPTYFDTTYMGSNMRFYPFYIPVIPAGQTEIVKMSVKTDQNIQVMAWLNPPYYHSPLNPEVQSCIAWAAAGAFVSGLTNFIPGAGCVNSVVTNYIYNPWDYPKPEPEQPKSWGSSLWTLATTGLSCASSFIPISQAAEFGISVISLGADIYNNYNADQDCKNGFKRKSPKNKNINAVSSFDPNEIVGPAGYNTENYTQKNSEYTYTIFFENKSDATAPAQEVAIIDTLDLNKFDITNFSFGPISFGDTTILPQTNGLTEFTMDVSIPNREILVRINAQLDTSTGIIKWYLVTLDTTTMELPEDPMGGFLPPNINPPEGEGSVTFTVGLKQSLTHGSEFKDKATIVFDMNAPLTTNEWSNKLDTIKPESHVNSLNNTITNTAFEVSWGGSDAGSGIIYYTIYVSINDSTYKPWKSYTSETSAIFTGVIGNIYKFYSIAYDSTGNVEDEPTTPDAQTELILDINNPFANENSVQVFPNPVNNEFTLIIPNGITCELRIYDVLGQTIFRSNITQSETKFHANFDNGIYFLELKTKTSTITKKLFVAK